MDTEQKELLADQKAELEIEKLQLETAKLKKEIGFFKNNPAPYYAVMVNFIAICITLGVTYSTGIFDKKATELRTEKTLLQIQIKEFENQRVLLDHQNDSIRIANQRLSYNIDQTKKQLVLLLNKYSSDTSKFNSKINELNRRVLQAEINIISDRIDFLLKSINNVYDSVKFSNDFSNDFNKKKQ